MSVFYEVYYLANNPDVAKAVNAGLFGTGWEHFLTFGSSEDRSFNEPDGYGDFNEEYYLAQNSDVAMAVAGGAFGTGWDHFQQFGEAEGRSYDAPVDYGDFNEEYYLANNSDVAKAVNAGAFGSGWDHFQQFGAAEGRSDDMPAGYDDFNEVFYLARNADVAKAVNMGIFATGWDHFLQFGQAEGRVDTRPISDVTHGGALPGEVPPDTELFTIYRDHYYETEVVSGTPPVYEERVYWGYNPPENGYYGDGNNGYDGENAGAPSDGGVPLEDLVSFLTTITGLDLTELGLIDNDGVGPFDNVTDINLALSGALSEAGEGGLNITFADGTTHTFLTDESAMSEQYFNFLNNLLFDEHGNSRLYTETVVISPGTSGYSTTTFVQGVVLTPNENNGMTWEEGFTSDADDTIVAGRLNLLHGAYIDAGEGYDVLEIDAKGYYAQPLQLLNIEQINIENLPNVYTDWVPGDGTGGVGENGEVIDTYPELDQDADLWGIWNSVIDLSRATSLETLVITESSFDGLSSIILDHTDMPGSLTVAGIRNGTTAVFEGSFTQDVNLHYGQGLTGPLTIELDLGMVTADLNFVHNSDDLILVSRGGNGESNTFSSDSIAMGSLTNLYITGDAFLGINGDLDDSFQDIFPVTIDASANTGGVSLELTESQNVTFLGSSGNDTFIVETDEWDPMGDTAMIDDESVTIVGGGGNNHFEIDSEIVDVTLLDGNNKVVVDSSDTLTITGGNGDNHFQVADAQQVSIVVGDGDNRMEIDATDWNDEGAVGDSLDYPYSVDITMGDGANDIDVEVDEYIGIADITAGDGGNSVDVSAHSVTVATGEGADVIKVLADEIRVNSGGGGDTITVGGWNWDFIGIDELGGNAELQDPPMAEWGYDGALIQIDTGAGASTVILGSDEDYQWEAENDFPGISSLTAIDTLHENSFITGEDVTLYVKTVADLRAADLSGINRVVLDDDAFDLDDMPTANEAIGGVNAAVLTLTASQFADIGAEYFEVEGSTFNTHGFIKIIVDESTSLTALGVDYLPRNIDLLLEIQDDVTLTMTAQQLHTRVAQKGITLANDGNTDYGNGSVVITGGGFDFDPFNTSDTISTVINGTTYYGGSLSDDFMVGDDWYNVSVQSVYKGYDRPADFEVVVSLTIDSDNDLVDGVVEAFDTIHTNLEIVGETDITSDGAIELGMVVDNGMMVPGKPFTVDFSGLEANVDGLVLDNFEMLAQGGGIYGNADNGYASEIHIHIANDPGDGNPPVEDGNDEFGWDEDGAGSLVSQGVQRYIVTKIDGPTANGSTGNEATIILCDTAQDIETFGLRGNWNDTLILEDAAWGLAFELQGGGTAKADGPTGTSNVGALVANYEWDGADAVVNLVHSVAGDTRPIHAEGIQIDNADSIEINADASSTTIEDLDGNSVETLTVVSSGDVVIGDPDGADLPTSLELIDASGVVGTFTASIDGHPTGNPADDMDGAFTFIGSQGGSFLTLDDLPADPNDDAEPYVIDGGVGGVELTIDGGPTGVDLTAATLTNITGVVLEDGAILSISMPDATAIGPEHFSLAEGAAGANLNLVDFDGEPFAVADYPEDYNITLTLANDPVVTLNPLTDLTGIDDLVVPEGTILELTAAQFLQLENDAISGPGSVHIYGLTQAEVGEQGEDLDLSGITVGGQLTVSLAESVDLSEAVVGNNTPDPTPGDFTDDPDPLVDVFNIPDGMTLILGDIQDGDHVQVNGGADSTLQFTDRSAAIIETIDASGFDVDFLRITNLLVSGHNVDYLFANLLERVEKVIYNDLSNVDGKEQVVDVEPGTTVVDDISFNDYRLDVEVTTLTVNMQGGTELSGDLVLSTVEVDWQADQLIPFYLHELVINSTGTEANLINGETANVITGDITPAAYPFAIGIGSRDNNLKNVTITADQDFVLDGKILFSSHGTDTAMPLAWQPNDGITANDDDAATATLTVYGDASTTIGDLDTGDDDVDFLVVDHLGDGDLTFGLSSLTTIDADDEITVNGSAVGTDTIIITGEIDLSDDTLINVDAIVLNNVPQDADLTLTQAQFDAIMAADGFSGADATTPFNDANLHIVEFDTDDFDATALPPEVTVASITLAGDMTIENSNLTGVGQIIVPEGATLTISADVFQQLVDEGTIVGVDAQGNPSNDFTVEITDLTNANVTRDLDGDGYGDADDGFDLSQVTADNITVSLGENVVTLGEFVDGVLVAGSESVIGDAEFILTDMQTLELVSFEQADGLDVTGTGTTTAVFRFDTGPGGAPVGLGTTLDASGYDVTYLNALNIFVGGLNVEFLIDDLASSVTLVIFHDPEDLGFLNQTNRVVIVEEGVTVHDSAVPGVALGFNDLDITDEVITLTMNLMGGVEIDGDIRLGTTTPPPDLQALNFQNLILVSTGTAENYEAALGGNSVTANIINGDISPFSAGPFPDNNLLNVDINADQVLEITGTIIYNSLDPDDDTATLDIMGTSDVTIKALDTTDVDIVTLTIANTGAGTLTITGGSDSLELDNTEELFFTGTGDIVLDTDDGPGNNGIDGEELSLINASGLSGDLTVGVIEDIDSDSFAFISGSGVTTLTMESDTLDSTGVDATPGTADDGTGWNFDFTLADVGSEIHLGTGLTFVDGSILNINLGPNTTLYIDESMDLSGLDLSITQTLDIVLADGAILTLTAAQADGLGIVAGPDTGAPGITAQVNIVDLGDYVDSNPIPGDPTSNDDPAELMVYDFSGIAPDIAGMATLFDDDVTLHTATDLGAFGINLKVLTNNDLDLSGQTIRFNSEAQAGRAVTVYDGGPGYVDPAADADYTNSSNVAWLFPSITAPVDTSAYDPEIGRLLFSEALVNSAFVGGDVENMFTTLPSTILRVDFADVTALDILLHSMAVNRIVELASYININDLTFSDDIDTPEEHIQTLTIKMGGEVMVGDLFLDDVVAPTVDPTDVHFDTLTIESRVALHDAHWLATEDYVNDNDGIDEAGEHVEPAALNTIGDIGVGPTNGVDLLDVVINTYGVANYGGGAQTYNVDDGADLSVQTLTFDSEVAGSTATLDVNGANDVTFKSVDGTDAEITTVTVNTAGHTGVFTVTGGSPAMDLDNTETLVIRPDGGGRVYFGYEWVDANSNGVMDPGEHTLNLDGANVPYAGVAGDDLSLIRVQGNAEVNLGVLASIDGTDDDTDGDTVPDQDAFFLNGNGNTTAILGEGNVDGAVVSPFLAAGSTWRFEDVTLTISEATAPMFVTGGILELHNVDLIIDGDVDLTMLVDDPLTPAPEGLFLTGTTTIMVPEGQSLTLTADQVHALSVDVVGEGTLFVVGEANPDQDINNSGHIKTVGVDISGVTVPVADADGEIDLTLGQPTDDDWDVGGPGNDLGHDVIGSPAVDNITTGIGDDTIIGGGGDDVLDAGPGDDTFDADAGHDFTQYLAEEPGDQDVVIVRSGASFTGELFSTFNPTDSFVATPDTRNEGGTGTILADPSSTNTLIDMSLAGGTAGWTIIGDPSNTHSNDTLTGSEFADIINGGNDNQSAAAAVDTLTGNGGNDVFVFNINTSTPADLTVTPQLPLPVDQEHVGLMIPDGADEGDESIHMIVTLNGVAQTLVINNPAMDVTDTNSMAIYIAAGLNNLAGVTATVDAVILDQVNARGDDNNSLDLAWEWNPVPLQGTWTTGSHTLFNGTDVAQVDRFDIDETTNPVTVGETYSLTATLSEGAVIGVNYTALALDDAQDVAVNLANSINAHINNGGEITATADNTSGFWGITIQDNDADNGGFDLTFGTQGVYNGSGASDIGGTDLAFADIITDFTTGEDKIDLGDMPAGTGTNYSEAPEVLDFTTARNAAIAAFGTGDQYYLTSIEDNPLTVAVDDPIGLLFFDANSDGAVDGVIGLMGVDSDHFAFTDIAA